jgi:hypothetical protein
MLILDQFYIQLGILGRIFNSKIIRIYLCNVLYTTLYIIILKNIRFDKGTPLKFKNIYFMFRNLKKYKFHVLITRVQNKY